MDNANREITSARVRSPQYRLGDRVIGFWILNYGNFGISGNHGNSLLSASSRKIKLWTNHAHRLRHTGKIPALF